MAASIAERRVSLACGGVTRAFGVALRVARDDAQGECVDVRTADGVRRVQLLGADDDGWRIVDVDGLRRRQLVRNGADRVQVVRDGAVHVFGEPSPYPQPDAGAAARMARAPVAGVVAQVPVQVGDRVIAGQPLACVEAMKMEMWLQRGRRRGRARCNVALRDVVAAGTVLVELDLDSTETTR